jgi:hypothetical protein
MNSKGNPKSLVVSPPERLAAHEAARCIAILEAIDRRRSLAGSHGEATVRGALRGHEQMFVYHKQPIERR